MKEKRKRSGRAAGVVSVLLCVLFFPVILVNVIIIANTYLHPDEIPGAFGVKPVAVLSGSMEDTFMTGDLIFLHKTDPANLQEGDVICYLASGQAVTHRVVRVERDGGGATRYITKGDANNAEDAEPVLPQQVQGIWKGGRIGGAGNAVLFLSSTTGMLLFIVCPILLLIVWDIITRRKADKNEKARADALEAELKALRAAQGVAGENEHRS